MRIIITVLCLLYGFLCPYTSASAQQISLAKGIRSYPEILAEIEANSDYRFSYTSDLFLAKGKIRFSAKEEAIEPLLTRLLDPAKIRYTIYKGVIILRPKEEVVVIQGIVRDAQDGIPLAGASLYDRLSGHGTATDTEGYYRLNLGNGTSDVQVSFIGYQPVSLPPTAFSADTVINITLIPDTALLKEVIIRSHARRDASPVYSTQMGKMSFTSKTLQQTPAMLGEADIIKTLQLTPGVAMGTEGTAGLFVRGGNNDENLFLIDGNPVYQVNHIGGVFSAFNPDAIAGMDFYKSAFPARYGGRLSSVVDIRTSEGNPKKIKGNITLGLISGNLSLEGPLFNKNTTFHIALRRTWLDVLSAPALAILNKSKEKSGDKFRMRYAFHDLNGKIVHRLNDNDKLFVSIYQGNDVFHTGYRESTDNQYVANLSDMNNHMRWGNLLTTAGWEHRYGPHLTSKVTAHYTRYLSKLSYKNLQETGKPDSPGYEKILSENISKNGIQDMGMRVSFDYRSSGSHRIRFGADLLYHIFQPEFARYQQESSNTIENPAQILSNDKLKGSECAVYAEDDWQVNTNFLINAGLRLSAFSTGKKTFFNAEPRLSARWLLHPDLSIKASYARMAQYVHQLCNSYLNLPTDTWMPVTEKLKPLRSDQFSAGIYYSLQDTWQFSMEGYFKKLHNLLDYKDGFTFIPGASEWESKLAIGTGRSYGIEWMLRKETGRTTGWVGYTLSWADRRFDEINEGRTFRSRYDNRHKLNIVVSHKINPLTEVTGSWSYSSGNRTTLPLECYAGEESSHMPDIEYVSERNNYQMPAYHRLDLGLNVYRPKKKNRMGIWNISIYNVYCRMNPFMVYQATKQIGDKYFPRFRQMSYFPIIPTVSYTYKF